MSIPTVGIGFSPTTPAPTDPLDQLAVPQGDNAQPLERFSFTPKKATSSLRGTVKPDGTTMSVDGSGVLSAANGGVSVKTANYTAVAADNGTLLSFADSSPVTAHTLTLPATPPFAKWKIAVQNIGTAALTINRNGLLLDTVAANLTLNSGQGMDISTDLTNYFTERGAGSVTLSGAANLVEATPDGTSGNASLRALVANDIPSLPESKITNLTTDLAAKVPSSRTIATTAPLTGGGDLSADRTLAISAFTGDSGSGGAAGAVPAPPAGSAAAGKFLKADGTWTVTGATFGGDLAAVDATHQKVIGLNTTPLDTTVSLIDGMTWQYNASSGKWVPIFDRATRPVSAVVGKPGAGQLVLIYTVEATETFPANFTGPQSYGSAGVNPTATAIYSIFKNASNVGTVSISTSGVFTFATTGGIGFSLNAGDRLTMVAPGSQDATLSDVGITLVGTRGPVSVSSSQPPIPTWRGAYSGSTAYSPYDEVSYQGSSYICVATTTGNLPTNTAFWNLLAAAGTTAITQLTGDVAAGPGSGSQAATIQANAITTSKINNAAVTLAKIQNAGANSVLVGSGATGSGTAYAEIALGTNLSITGTTLNASGGGGFPWTFVQEAAFAYPSGAVTSMTVTFPHALAAGGATAFMLLAYDGNNTVTLPAGWTVDFNIVQIDVRLVLLHKTSASDTTAVFSSSGTGGLSITFFEISGSHALDQSSTGTIAGTFPGSITMPAITPAAGAVVFAAAAIIVSSMTPPPQALQSVNPNWRPLGGFAGNFNGSRVLIGHVSTVAAAAVSTKPPTINSQAAAFGSGGTAYATFSIL